MLRVGCVNQVPAFGRRPRPRRGLPALEVGSQAEHCFELASKPSPGLNRFERLVRFAPAAYKLADAPWKRRKVVWNGASPAISQRPPLASEFEHSTLVRVSKPNKLRQSRAIGWAVRRVMTR